MVKLPCSCVFALLSAGLALPAKDLSDYPLQVQFLGVHQEVVNVNPGTQLPMFVHKVNGHGNVKDSSGVHAFDFEYQGPVPLGPVPLNQRFPARWKKPQAELEILVPDVGHEGKYTACRMGVLAHQGVYVRNAQGVIELSQGDYPAGKTSRATAAPPAETPPTGDARLSVGSSPAGADIEVDGDFVGSTPSVLQLSLGEHTITLRKAGYQAWERKMQLVAGDITLNPQLEPQNPR